MLGQQEWRLVENFFYFVKGSFFLSLSKAYREYNLVPETLFWAIEQHRTPGDPLSICFIGYYIKLLQVHKHKETKFTSLLW